jgi:putative ABC transport system permease protein
MNDARFALRQLSRAPGFTAIAVATLGLGIGACVAIFSVVNGVLLSPLPFPQPDRLVVLRETFPPTVPDSSVAYAKYMDWRDQATSFESMGALDGMSYNLGGTEPVHLRAARVTASLLATLGVTPARGRNILPEDEVPDDGDSAAMVSHGLWQRRFASRPDIVGERVQLNGRPYTVVGVLPRDSGLPERIEVFTPLALTERARQFYSHHSLQVFARLRTGVTAEQAEHEMAAIAARTAQAHPESKGWAVKVSSLTDTVVGPVRPALLALLAAVGLLLLIACANIANLLLARATARATEVALRAAVGASRGRIVRQLLVESLLLSLVGGALGVVIAHGGLEALLALAPETLPRAARITIDGWALAFAFALALVTGVGFGLVPALQATRVQLNEVLKQGGRGAGEGIRRRRLRGLLVVGELAIALWLLAGAGLFTRSFIWLGQVEPGFDPRGVEVASVFLPRPMYNPPALQIAFARQVLTAITSLPGVEAAAVAANVPFSTMHLTDMSATTRTFAIPERPALSASDVPVSSWYTVTSDYFQAMGIPILRGRAFDDRDRPDARQVAIISETLARKFFPGEDPLGKVISIGGPAPREIVGIARDIKSRSLEGGSALQTYHPFAQSPDNDMVFVVRTAGAAPVPADAIRRAIASVDATIPAYDGHALSALVDASIARQRFAMTLFAVFSGVALLLAAMGIYGVMAYSVSQRTGEIGIRMALGAQASAVMRLVLAQGGRLVVWGVLAGVAGALVLTRFLEGLLSGVSTRDPLTFMATVVVLVVVATTACLLPARRAARLDPVRALRRQ